MYIVKAKPCHPFVGHGFFISMTHESLGPFEFNRLTTSHKAPLFDCRIELYKIHCFSINKIFTFN